METWAQKFCYALVLLSNFPRTFQWYRVGDSWAGTAISGHSSGNNSYLVYILWLTQTSVLLPGDRTKTFKYLHV